MARPGKNNSRDQERTITLLGQSSAGKTHLLSALLNSANACNELLQDKHKPDAPYLEKPRFTARHTDNEAVQMDIERLTNHFATTLLGREFDNQGTDRVARYPGVLNYDVPAPAPPPKKDWRGRNKPVEQRASRPRQVLFQIVDGRGGDIAREFDLSEAEDMEGTRWRETLQDYRDGMAQSVGLVICVPLFSDPKEFKEHFDTKIFRRFLFEIKGALQAKRTEATLPRLSNVALCFTKYEGLFSEAGTEAYDHAVDRQTFVDIVHELPALKLFQDLVAEPEVKVRIFPASTFGFVDATLAPNFYPYPEMPGLLTRHVREQDYSDRALPGYRDHFPMLVSPQDAERAWHPFNIAPPFLYALTGEEIGPMCFRPEELGL